MPGDDQQKTRSILKNDVRVNDLKICVKNTGDDHE